MNTSAQISKYEFFNIIRNRWIIFYSLLLLIFTDLLFRFGGDNPKVFISLMNVILILIPLLSTMFGIISFYNSREFIELLLAQPIDRKELYLGIYSGIIIPLSLSFVLGISVPFMIHAEWNSDKFWSFLVLLITGIGLTLIFVAISYLIAVKNEEKVKGFGIALLLWFFFTFIFDGLLLLILFLFDEYPLEKFSIILTLFNPIDLARILLLLRLDIAALMGYTGAVFHKFFGSFMGFAISGSTLLLWISIPIFWGIKSFIKKDF